MTRIRNIAIVGATTLSALALVAGPASAATTTIRTGDANGAPYSGAVSSDLLGDATVSTSIGSGSCTESNMTGSISSDGTGLAIDSASFTGNGGGPCTGSTTSTITAQNVPWTGGSAVYAPVAGGKDGTVTIANFRVKAVVNLFGGITCIFGGNLTADLFNSDNANRPDPTAVSQAVATNATVNKVSSGSSWLCPSTAQVTATYALTGGGTTLHITE